MDINLLTHILLTNFYLCLYMCTSPCVLPVLVCLSGWAVLNGVSFADVCVCARACVSAYVFPNERESVSCSLAGFTHSWVRVRAYVSVRPVLFCLCQTNVQSRQQKIWSKLHPTESWIETPSMTAVQQLLLHERIKTQAAVMESLLTNSQISNSSLASTGSPAWQLRHLFAEYG